MTTTAPVPGSIVVGIDGSPSSARTVDWAARQAVLEHRRLTVVHAAHLGVDGDALWAEVAALDLQRVHEEVTSTGRDTLRAVVDRLAQEQPGLEVHQVLSTEDPRQVLLALAADAALTVVGSRGLGPVRGLLLGSVSLAVSRHASGPVVVVRSGGTGSGGGVLVDVDGTADSLPAIEFAYRTAAVRGLPLTALHVFWDAAHSDEEEHVVRDEEPGLDDVRALLAESVAGMRETYPEVADRLVLQRGFRDRELLRASREASLVVVGVRHRSRIDDFLHGSVAAAVVERAPCDAAIVPVGGPPR